MLVFFEGFSSSLKLVKHALILAVPFEWSGPLAGLNASVILDKKKINHAQQRAGYELLPIKRMGSVETSTHPPFCAKQTAFRFFFFTENLPTALCIAYWRHAFPAELFKVETVIQFCCTAT